MLALRLACRDLRGALGGFRLLIAVVALGTAAIAAIGLLSAGILDGVRAGARLSVGGDVSLRLFHHPPPPGHLAAFAGAGTASLTAELRPLARHADRSVLVEMKAVDDAYPLYGALGLDPDIAPADALGRRGGLWGAVAADSLLSELDASIGDIVAVGEHRFELRARIKAEPDRAMRAFSLGPRMIVALPAIADSALVEPGAQVYWYSRIRLEPGRDAAAWIAGFDRAFPEAGYRIVNADDGVPGVERSVAIVTTLAMFVAMGILLIGCVGIGSAVTAYLDRKRDTIAILKGLGARSPLILRLYLAQVLTAAVAGIALGLAFGSIVPFAVAPLMAEWLPLGGTLRAGPLLTATGFGLLATLLFSLWPLARAEAQSPQAALRHLFAPTPSRPRPSRLAAMLLIAAALGGLLVWSAPLPVVAALFAAAAALVTLAFLGLGRLVSVAARLAGGGRSGRRPLLRLALANIHRPGAPTTPLVMALGLGLTLLVSVATVRDNADRHLAATVPDAAPALVVLDVLPGDAARFDAVMAGMGEVVRWERKPFLHARVSRIAGQPVAERRIPADIAFVIRGDRGLSWRAEPPRGGIVAGTWWGRDYSGPPLLSLDEKVAGRLGVSIGDSLTLTVLGAPLTAEIASLRKMDWSGLTLDFPILLSPPPDPPPHREIAALWIAPERVDAARAQLAHLFPEAPIVVVGEVIAVLKEFADGAGAVLVTASVAAALAALTVLAGAVAAGRRRRLRETALLKVLGATRRQILAATALEFFLIGVATAVPALIAGTLAAWVSLGDLIDFSPAPAAALFWAALALSVTAAVGLLAAWRALALPAGRVLREP